MGFDYQPDEFPVVFWDLFGEQGHPIRATVSRWGRCCSSRMLDLNDVQEGVLNIAFRFADDDPELKAAEPAAWSTSRICARCWPILRQARQGDRARSYGNVADADGRHDPAPAAGAGEPGRRRNSSASRRSTIKDFMQHRPRRPRQHQHPGRRQADGEPAALRDLPAVAAVGAVRGAARGRRSATSRSSCSSSTRRTCCSTTRRRRCSTRSSRWCG